MGKQLELFPELDLNSKEPIQYDHGSGQFINKFKEVPVRKPNAVPPKTKTIQKYKDGSKPKFREENLNERLERIMYENGESNIKPKHYDNPNIIDTENYKKMPKKFDNNDPSTYPSDRDQRQRISSWDLILDTTSKSGTPEEKKEMRSYLREKYNDPDQRKHLGKKELKFISAYKDPKETIAAAPIIKNTIPIPTFDPPKRDPEMERLEQNFKRIFEDAEREKQKNRTSGLAGLLGIE